MTDQWEKSLACAVACGRCDARLTPRDQRILSVIDHAPICLHCKAQEETRSDYADIAQRMIGTCMMETEVMYGDPGGYCYYHFYPFTCER